MTAELLDRVNSLKIVRERTRIKLAVAPPINTPGGDRGSINTPGTAAIDGVPFAAKSLGSNNNPNMQGLALTTNMLPSTVNPKRAKNRLLTDPGNTLTVQRSSVKGVAPVQVGKEGGMRPPAAAKTAAVIPVFARRVEVGAILSADYSVIPPAAGLLKIADAGKIGLLEKVLHLGTRRAQTARLGRAIDTGRKLTALNELSPGMVRNAKTTGAKHLSLAPAVDAAIPGARTTRRAAFLSGIDQARGVRGPAVIDIKPDVEIIVPHGRVDSVVGRLRGPSDVESQLARLSTPGLPAISDSSVVMPTGRMPTYKAVQVGGAGDLLPATSGAAPVVLARRGSGLAYNAGRLVGTVGNVAKSVGGRIPFVSRRKVMSPDEIKTLYNRALEHQAVAALPKPQQHAAAVRRVQDLGDYIAGSSGAERNLFERLTSAFSQKRNESVRNRAVARARQRIGLTLSDKGNAYDWGGNLIEQPGGAPVNFHRQRSELRLALDGNSRMSPRANAGLQTMLETGKRPVIPQANESLSAARQEAMQAEALQRNFSRRHPQPAGGVAEDAAIAAQREALKARAEAARSKVDRLDKLESPTRPAAFSAEDSKAQRASLYGDKKDPPTTLSRRDVSNVPEFGFSDTIRGGLSEVDELSALGPSGLRIRGGRGYEEIPDVNRKALAVEAGNDTDQYTWWQKVRERTGGYPFQSADKWTAEARRRGADASFRAAASQETPSIVQGHAQARAEAARARSVPGPTSAELERAGRQAAESAAAEVHNTGRAQLDQRAGGSFVPARTAGASAPAPTAGASAPGASATPGSGAPAGASAGAGALPGANPTTSAGGAHAGGARTGAAATYQDAPPNPVPDNRLRNMLVGSGVMAGIPAAAYYAKEYLAERNREEGVRRANASSTQAPAPSPQIPVAPSSAQATQPQSGGAGDLLRDQDMLRRGDPSLYPEGGYWKPADSLERRASALLNRQLEVIRKADWSQAEKARVWNAYRDKILGDIQQHHDRIPTSISSIGGA